MSEKAVQYSKIDLSLQRAKDNEKKIFHPKAAFSSNHSRLEEEKPDWCVPYKRDVERILHSKAYSRYTDKTQVVYLVENDHITTRSQHVQQVGSFSKGIAEILGLNLNLVEAIALGHDVGHPPFGHEGEGYLSELAKEHGAPVFTHPRQSCRLLFDIEPLNLGLAVYDGFLCHDVGMQKTKLMPHFAKTWDDHFQELEKKVQKPGINFIPKTLEGCLVKICDTMSYVGKDIEDAISLGIIDPELVPKSYLGKTNSQILRTMALDIIENSLNKDYIAISDKAHKAFSELRKFNFQNIYSHPKLKVESEKVKRGYRILFELLLEDVGRNDGNSFIKRTFLDNKSEKYLKNTGDVQIVIDYIAGMTDGFFVKTLELFAVPKRIEL